MGLLSFLFGKADDADEKTDEKEEATQSEFPTLERGMALTVTIGRGKLFLSGRLAEFSAKSKTMSIERAPGQLAFNICDPGTAIMIRGYSYGTTPFDLKGKIKESTRTLCVINNLEAIPYDEQRNNFRLDMNIPISMYYQEDERLQNPESCTLINLSTGGACVESEFIHGEGEILRIKVQVGEYVPMTFLGQVIRVEEHPHNRFRYGILFAKLDEQEITMLTKILFNIQTGNKKEHGRDRNGPGAWY